MMNETWKDVDGYFGYQVSNLGRVRTRLNDRGEETDTFELLDIFIDADTNRRCVRMYRYGWYRARHVDTLVSDVFCRADGNTAVTVHHIDGDPRNDRADNLYLEDPVARDPIIAIHDGNGEKLFFSSRKEAAETLGLNAGNISSVLSGKLRVAGLYRFECARMDISHSGRSMSIVAENVETGEQIIFSSQNGAAKSLEVRQPNVCACLKGRLKQTGGYRFWYERKW